MEHKGNIPTQQDAPLNGEADLQQDTSQRKPIWQRIMDMGDEIPIEEWRAAVPSDLAKNVDCYLYGSLESQR